MCSWSDPVSCGEVWRLCVATCTNRLRLSQFQPAVRYQAAASHPLQLPSTWERTHTCVHRHVARETLGHSQPERLGRTFPATCACAFGLLADEPSRAGVKVSWVRSCDRGHACTQNQVHSRMQYSRRNLASLKPCASDLSDSPCHACSLAIRRVRTAGFTLVDGLAERTAFESALTLATIIF